MTGPEQAFRTHRPDSPFGCAETWGPRIAAHPDGRVHVCNLTNRHDDDHLCKCGATFEGAFDES